MSEFKKLFHAKRILALVLAIAMAVTILPTTAYAAPSADNVLEEETSAVSGPADETVTIGQTNDDADDRTSDGDDEAKGPADAEDTDADIPTTAENETDVFEIVDNNSSSDRIAEYNGDTQFEGSVLDNIVIKHNGEVIATLADYGDTVLDGKLTTKWVVKDADTATTPKDAGNYQLIVTIPANTSNNNAETKETFDFEITKEELTVSVDPITVNPGTKAKDVPVSLTVSGIDFSAYYDSTEETDPEAKLAVEKKIKNAVTNAELGDEEELAVNGDYAVTLTFEFTAKATAEDTKNSTLPEKYVEDIKMSGLVSTKIDWKYTEAYVKAHTVEEKDEDGNVIGTTFNGRPFTYTYTGKAQEPIPDEDYEAKVRILDYDTDKYGQPIYTYLPGDIKKVWYDSKYNELEFDTEEAQAPVDAGTYYFKLHYEGKEGVYAECDSFSIQVDIKPAVLEIIPGLKNGTVFTAGTTVGEVLAQVEYEVYEYDAAASDYKGARFDNTGKFDKNRFWGTSYDNASVTQSYEPIFMVCEEVKETVPVIDEDGKEVTKEVTYYQQLNKYAALEAGKIYHIEFTGKKGVYQANGSIMGSVYDDYDYITDINNYTYPVHLANPDSINYEVDVIYDEDEAGYEVTYGPYNYEFEVTAAAETTLEINLESNTKEYDGKPLFADRAEYKKAVVKAGNTTVAQGSDSSLTYIWYKQDGFDTEYMGTYFVPEDAGTYKLEVIYYDRAHKNKSVSDEVTYEITPREIKVVPTGSYEVYEGIPVWQFLRMTDITYEIKPNDETVAIEELSNWIEGYDYKIGWCVEKQTDAAKDEWESLGDYDKFAEGDKIRLAVKYLTRNLGYNDNYTDCRTEEKTIDGTIISEDTYFHKTAEITVKKMGGAELTVETDLTKLTEKSKVYDGNAFDISGVLTSGLIKMKEGETDVTNAVISEMEGFWVEKSFGKREIVAKPVDVGTYTYYLVFNGNDDYQPFPYDVIYERWAKETNITYTITKAELTVTPSVKDEVAAGTYGHYAHNVNAAMFATPADRDKEAFTYKRYYDEDGNCHYGYQAISGVIYFDVVDEKGNDWAYEKLKGLETYTIKFRDAVLNGIYERNYTLKAGESVSFTTVRCKSGVAGASASVKAVNNQTTTISSVRVKDAAERTQDGSYTHTVTALQDIPYYYGVTNSATGEKHDGNYIAIKITMPAEYDSLSSINPLYTNSIESAGGFVPATGSNYIVAVFNARWENIEDAKKEFDIRWEDGYVEHFILDFTYADFEADFTEAVAPKSLAFNNAVKKMAVGGEQQLDVKLSKSQVSDIIHLSYKVDNEDVLCVDESGIVTALAKGNATITVYSSKKVLDSAYEGGVKWVETTPGKKATVKITVSDVTVPKIKSVTTQDNWATVYWPAVGNGYRREVYVLKGKGITTTEFETKIASMKNEAWEGIFEIAPTYDDYYNSNTKLYYAYLEGLSAQETYTVYVRNVSAIRTLDDGCQVSESHAGAVKSFTTTKSQLNELRFDTERIDASYDKKNGCYTVALSKGSLTMPLEGLFPERAENVAADVSDGIWKDLPLSKNDKKNYLAPKLVYYVGEAHDTRHENGDGCMNSAGGGMVFNYYDNDGDRHYAHLYNTSLATVKNGKLTLKGVGKVAVVALDTNTYEYAVALVDITANANGIKGKTVKMQVGQSVSLYDMVTYSEGKKALIGDFHKSIVVDDALRKVFEDDGRFELNDTTVTAVRSGGKALTFKVKDSVVGGDKEATVKLSVAAFDSVKNLKTTFLTDQFADLEFTYTGYAEAFRILVTDARGNILQSKYVPKNSSKIYNADTGKYVYRIGNLTKKSKYNVTITALYGDSVSKQARKTFTTTLLPASYLQLDDKIKNDPYYTGGVNIIAPYRGNKDIGNAWFISGNTYTLALDETDDDLNKEEKYAKTDTLLWTSTNKKVATVKANAGTYTSTLKAVGVGSAYIEVRSKITKAVIARWRVFVNAVADANGYYGDNETIGRPTEDSTPPGETKAYVRLVSVGTFNPVKKNVGEYQWFSFTAPSAGTFDFSSGYSDVYAWFFYNTDRPVIDSIGNDADSDTLDGKCSEYVKIGGSNTSKQIQLAKGEIVYFAVGSDKLANEIDSLFTVRKTASAPKRLLTLDNNASIRVQTDAGEYQWISFKALKTANYEFTSSGYAYAWFFTSAGYNKVANGASDDDLKYYSTLLGYGYNNSSSGDYLFSGKSITLFQNTTIYIAVGGKTPKDTVDTDVGVRQFDRLVPDTVTVDEAKSNVSALPGKYQWVKFEAPADGTYELKISGSGSSGYYKVWFFNQNGYDVTGDYTTTGILDNNSDNESYGYGASVYNENGDYTPYIVSKELELSANETVYIALGYYDNLVASISGITVSVEDITPVPDTN